MDKEYFFNTAFVRNIGLLTKEEQEKLRLAKVGIVGVGGVGGFHLMNLVRLGVGKFAIADLDCYELANIQRQCGAYIDTLGKNKAEVMRDMVLAINPHLEIDTYTQGISADNIDKFLTGVDVLIDGIDFFCIEERRMIFKKAREKGIYAITAGPLGFGSALLIFSPTGMTFDSYFDLNDNMSFNDKIVAFGVGLAPAALQMEYLKLDAVNIRTKQGPSLVSACNLCASLASTEALMIILKKGEPKAAPYYLQMDPYLKKLKQGYLWGGNRHPWQKIKRWYAAKKLAHEKAA